MMWMAHTMQGEIALGTEFAVYPSSWTDNDPVTVPEIGDTIAIEFPNNARTRATVEAANATQAIWKVANAVTWELGRLEPKQAHNPFSVKGGAPISHWKITRLVG